MRRPPQQATVGMNFDDLIRTWSSIHDKKHSIFAPVECNGLSPADDH